MKKYIIKGDNTMDKELQDLLKDRFEIVYHDVDLLEQAFTHSSYVNEHRYLKLEDNERLEFLGDAVLELLVSRFIYDTFTDVPEGVLTKMRSRIVREDSLCKFALQCGFDKFVKLGRGEEASGGRTRPALLCDLFESFLGSLYLDQGLSAALKFLQTIVFPKIEAGVFSHEMDYKTQLQEVLQRGGDVDIDYRLISDEGPAHEKLFCTEIWADEQKLGTGTGKSKKAAEQAAAKNALTSLS